MPSPFVRAPGGPVLTAQLADADDEVLAFNPGVVRLGAEWLMAYRVDHGVTGDPNIVATSIRFATSRDGVQWQSQPDLPTIDRSRAIELLQPLEPHRRLDSEIWRMYDPRLHVIDDALWPLVMTAAVDTVNGLRPAVLGSRDGGRTWFALSFGLPDNRNLVFFPDRIDGYFLRLERPCNEYGGEALGAGRFGIWLSRSPDLFHWGSERLVLEAQAFGSDVVKIGPGAPPIRTDEGWLCFVHLVFDQPSIASSSPRGWEGDWSKRYVAGAVLLDLDDPSEVVAVAREPVLEPVERHERHGFRDDVIFPGGAVLVSDRADGPGDTVWLFYGAADTCVGLARASLDAVLGFVNGPR